MKIVMFGSSLVSAYWNGAATYYRGICKAMYARGHDVVSYRSSERPADTDLLHPYLAAAAALRWRWSGAEVLHAGAEDRPVGGRGAKRLEV